MTPFEEADRRLGGMHGYESTPPMVFSVEQRLLAHVVRIQAQLDAQETLLRSLILALRAGAVGKWS